jgi:hypothetical protein
MLKCDVVRFVVIISFVFVFCHKTKIHVFFFPKKMNRIHCKEGTENITSTRGALTPVKHNLVDQLRQSVGPSNSMIVSGTQDLMGASHLIKGLCDFYLSKLWNGVKI